MTFRQWATLGVKTTPVSAQCLISARLGTLIQGLPGVLGSHFRAPSVIPLVIVL